MIPLMHITSRRILCLVAFSLLVIALTTGQAHAFDKLSEAQDWIYNRSHLANTSEGQVLSYRYAGQDDSSASIEDKASVSITGTHEDGRRDVEIDFLSDERHLPLPAFTGYRGNPVIIAMLEHIAQSISNQTGGGALYFRNRIRDALASKDIGLEETMVQYNDNEVAATRITFSPFTDDPYLKANELIRQSRFSIELSDAIPGGVFSIAIEASHEARVFEKTLSLI